MTKKDTRFDDVEIGDEFHRLTVTSKPWKCPVRKQLKVNVKCMCGVEKTAIVMRLFSGNVKSCGCLNKERHSQFCGLLRMDARKKKR